MAGGSGERFWPLSRKRRPKQLLPLASEKAMITESIERISPIIPAEDIYIITSASLLEPIRKILTSLPPENIIAEPHKRNTAPCLALAAAIITEKYSVDFNTNEISIAVLTADQVISPNEGFIKTVEAALDFVESHEVICTIGIPPSRPETGYGYIEVATPFDNDKNKPEIKHVLHFREKPTLEKAIEYITTNNFLWNSGMFFWRLDVFIKNLSECLPEVGTKIGELRKCYKNETGKVLEGPLVKAANIFEAFPDISIDYGLMEKAKEVFVAKACFSWDDIGSWDSLNRVRKEDETGNIISGKTAVFDLKNSTIINASSNNEIVFAGFGLENIVVVVTDNAILVCPKERVQEVKKCVEILKKENGEKWL